MKGLLKVINILCLILFILTLFFIIIYTSLDYDSTIFFVFCGMTLYGYIASKNKIKKI